MLHLVKLQHWEYVALLTWVWRRDVQFGLDIATHLAEATVQLLHHFHPFHLPFDINLSRSGLVPYAS